MASASSLPPLYAGWMDTLLGAPIPVETTATCASCAMISDAGSAEPGYNPDTKCCTYLPELWNFLAGAALLDDSSDGRRAGASVRARLAAREAVRPLGLGQSDAYWMRYVESPAPKFGSDPALLCPHYVNEAGGLCGIWQHRESTCATWFCKHDRGRTGQDFWERLRRVLHTAEEALSRWTLRELGASADDWGSWSGREGELYTECARLVQPLAWHDVRRIAGPGMSAHEDGLARAFLLLASDAIPLHPAVELVQISTRGAGRVRLATYSAMDALELPEAVAAVLPYFDGRPTEDALADIQRSAGVRIEPSLVRKLTDFGVLRDLDADATLTSPRTSRA